MEHLSDNLNEFRIYYNRIIFPELRLLERVRRGHLALLVAIALASLVVGLWLVTNDNPVLRLLFWLPVYFFLLALRLRTERWRRQFKPRIVGLILKFIDPKLRYHANGFIHKEKFLASKLFVTDAETYKCEDYIAGKVGEIDFEACEIDVRETPRVQGAPTHVFHGLFFCAKLRETFQHQVLVMPNIEAQYHLRSIKALTRSGGIRVTVGDEGFDKYFQVFTDSSTDVVNLLSKRMLAQLLHYRETYQKTPFLSFTDGWMYIGIHYQKDILEPKLWQSNLSFDLARSFYEDLHLLTGILRDFDLNN